MSTPLHAQYGLRVGESFIIDPNASISGIPRSKMDQESLQAFPIPLDWFRVWDGNGGALPSAGATDDLGLYWGTFGTNHPTIKTGDLKAAGATTRYARVQIPLPRTYDAGSDVVIRFKAGMETSVSDTTAQIDLAARRMDYEGGVGADICSTSALDINSLTLSDKDFVITAGSLSPGDMLDALVSIAINDGASVSDVIGKIGAATLLCDTRG